MGLCVCDVRFVVLLEMVLTDNWIDLISWIKCTLFIFDIWMIDYIFGAKCIKIYK